MAADTELKTHSEYLKSHLSFLIEQQGVPLSFFQYMNHALYHPEWGYYRRPWEKFGAEGDFVTAPEITPLFSQCLARQCVEMKALLGSYSILECGAGTGQMALAILEFLDTHDALPEQYLILELSGHLRSRQRDLILSKHPGWEDRLRWLQAWPADNSFVGMVLANELFDAMPVEVFRRAGSGFERAMVAIEDDDCVWRWQTADADLQQSLDGLGVDFAEGYQSEYNPNMLPWIQSLSACLQRGVFIAIDYGFPRSVYYHPDRNRGTLMCHLQHRAHDNPLLYPGIQDITAHVDFTLLVEAADTCGLELQGFVSQAHALLNAGITDLLSDDEAVAWKQKQALQRLLHPGEMGELFQWMGLSRGMDDQLSCFAAFDQSHRL